MIRRPPRSTRTGHTLSLHDALPISLADMIRRHSSGQQVGGDLSIRLIGQGDEPVSMRVVGVRSEEHTSELQSLMRISYAVFCLKKKKNKNKNQQMRQQNRQSKQNRDRTNAERS